MHNKEKKKIKTENKQSKILNFLTGNSYWTKKQNLGN